MPENKKLYAAGAEYDGPAGLTEFKFVRPAGFIRPYLSKNPNGLLTTKHHAGLYELDMENKIATLVREPDGSDVKCPKTVKLTTYLIREIQRGIEVE